MPVTLKFLLTIAMLVGATISAQGEPMPPEMPPEIFSNHPETRWRVFTDTVMGGVSTGQLSFEREGATHFARLSGKVSTKNRGGFIQMQMKLDAPPEGARGVRIVMRGNDEDYFVHLRSRTMLLPWQYYQARFHATARWTEVKLPFTAFTPSGGLLRAEPRAKDLKSIGVVAYGKDYEASVDVKEIGFY